MSINSSSQYQTKGVNVFHGYLFACAAGSATFGMLFAFTTNNSRPIGLDELVGMIGVIVLIFLMMCIVALPGFAVLRFVLRVLRRTDWPSFAVAGAINAMISNNLFSSIEDLTIADLTAYWHNPVVPLSGAVAGVASCFAERYFARQAVTEVSSV